ncbi:MAG: ComF family protein [Phormidesmis sp.]
MGFVKASLAFRPVIGLFLSRGCPVCDRPTAQTFCLDCQRQIFQPKTAQNQPKDRPDPSGNPALPISALGQYEGALKRAILAMKYSDRPEVALPLGTALGWHWLAQQKKSQNAVNPIDRTAVYAVPIPLHDSRQKSRGFNQAELIARAFCRVSKLPLLAHGLVRAESTRPQHELGLTERQQNLAQVFQIGASLHQRANRARSQGKARPTVLLVDDIYTTGATVQSAAATLSQNGIAVVGVATVARAYL